eukprot:s1908_g7.t1
MDDLLMAVAGETLRWRGDLPKSTEDKDTEKEMKLLEFAFRMGQSALGGSSSSNVSSNASTAMEEELAGLEETTEQKHTVSADAGIAKLQDALKNRNAQKKEAQAVGATPKSLSKKPAAKVLQQKPAAKVALLKRPSTKQLDRSDTQSAGKRTSKKVKVLAKPKKRARELKMTRECIYSRAYHQALHCAAALVSATDEEKTSKMPAIFPDVSDVQEKVKAAQQVLKDVRAVFGERAALNKAQKEAAKPKENCADAKTKAAPKRRATSKQAGQ